MPNYNIPLDATTAHLRKGQLYTINQAMFALLVPSGCDAAHFLAYNLGSFFDNLDPVKGFVS